jgi:hypothetical protein
MGFLLIFDVYSGVTHDHFVEWQKSSCNFHFGSVRTIMMYAKALCGISLQAKVEAQTHVAEFGQLFCNIDVNALRDNSHLWAEGSTTAALRTADTPMMLEEEAALDLTQEDEDGDKDNELSWWDDVVVVSTVDTSEGDVVKELFFTSETSIECVQKRQVIATSLKSIVEQRVGTCEDKPSNVPLTSRPVERMFSGWRRLMEKCPFTRSSTAQAMFLLKEFNPSDVLLMLKEVPFTQAIQAYLKTLRDEDNQAHLDIQAYERALKKTTESRNKLIQNKQLMIIAKHHMISSYLMNVQKRWYKAHSLEFFQKADIELSTTEQRSTATSLKELVLVTFAKQHPEKCLHAILSFGDGPHGGSLQTLTHVIEDTGTSKQAEPPLYEVEKIVGHKLVRKSKCFDLF